MQELDVSYFDAIWDVMQEAFPIEEYRTYEKQRALFDLEQYHVYGLLENGELKAFLACFEFDNIRFGEHLATHSSLRGSGIGKELFLHILKMDDKPLIFEVEKPETEMAKRRIGFYARLNCHLYPDVGYVQPPFHDGVKPTPLRLMSAKRIFNEDELSSIIDYLYEHVYHYHPTI